MMIMRKVFTGLFVVSSFLPTTVSADVGSDLRNFWENSGGGINVNAPMSYQGQRAGFATLGSVSVRTRTRNTKPSAFVAYTGRDKELSNIIFSGIGKANSVDACLTRFEPWEYNDISGNHLLSPILEGIDASPFIVADITYLNPNVVYEIGFAIGRKKKVLLIRNSDFPGDRDLAKSVGIFDTIGYSSYRTDDDLRNKLTSHISTSPLPFEVSVNNQAPVYVMPNNGKSTASTHLIGRVKKGTVSLQIILFSRRCSTFCNRCYQASCSIGGHHLYA